MRLLLALRALFFVLLLPGTVAGNIPFSILRAGNLLRVPDLGLASVCAAVFAITGALVLLRCVWDFFAAGKGTLAPIDPPADSTRESSRQFQRRIRDDRRGRPR